MKKLIFCISLVCMGMLSSCVDKNELVDEETKPDWLGTSIYGSLSNPGSGNALQGTFRNYLRLVDDLGYAETLNRTGSKTVFPANDEAFERFYQNNTWGVSKYEDLTNSQKKMLLYSSMLDNAILVELLSNVSSDEGVVRGNAVKHATSLNTIDTVTTYPFLSALDAYGENNPFWTRFNEGVSVVSDATRPMLVHFTRNYMLKNNITTTGDNSDFSIISGGSYENANDAYVFGNRIIAQDVTCQNGYIHQVEDVVTPPGNMAQVIKTDPNLSIFSHMLDRFAMPVYNAEVTQQFHDWYAEQSAVGDMSGVYNPDSIYEVRYLSKSSKGSTKFSGDARSGGIFADDYLLTFDPGWNEYYIASVSQSGSTASPELADIAAMFVPTNDALIDYFTNNPSTSILLETYGKLPNLPENVMSNIEDVPLNILSKLVSNVMNTSFASSVPSKFSSVVDDAKDIMGLSLSEVKTKDGGGYDVKIANNGVIYVMNKVYGPKAYEVVSAPALFNSSTTMGMTNWIIQNVSFNNNYALGLDYYAYLLSTSSNYAMFLPTKEAFDHYILDPTSLGRDANAPEYIHYYIDNSVSMSQGGAGIGASRWRRNAGGGLDSIGILDLSASSTTTYMPIVKAQLSELIQMNTIVLDEGETLRPGYYLTKNGAGVKVEGSGNLADGRLYGGGQLVEGREAPAVTEVFEQSNGNSYAVNRLVEGTTRSVYSFLESNDRFSEFFKLCNDFDAEVAEWAGISSEKNPETGIVMADQYRTFFVPGEGSTNQEDQLRCLDNNVKFFSNYNYTLYAPDNDAMKIAVEHGLPTWEEINGIAEPYITGATTEGEADAKKKVFTMIKAVRDFIRYHFHSNSVFASGNFESGATDYTTFLVDEETYINRTLEVSVDNSGKIYIKDAQGEKVIDPSNTALLTNEMTRDMEFEKNRASSNNYVTASSYAVVHELSEPLSYNSNQDYSQGLVSVE